MFYLHIFISDAITIHMFKFLTKHMCGLEPLQNLPCMVWICLKLYKWYLEKVCICHACITWIPSRYHSLTMSSSTHGMVTCRMHVPFFFVLSSRRNPGVHAANKCHACMRTCTFTCTCTCTLTYLCMSVLKTGFFEPCASTHRSPPNAA